MESGHDSVALGSQKIVSMRFALSALLGDGNDKLAGQRLYIGRNYLSCFSRMSLNCTVIGGPW
jgi:hypothetical protein